MTPAQRGILVKLENDGFLGQRPRLADDKDRSALKRLGYIKSSPPNAGRFNSRGGKGWGWQITDAGLAALAATAPDREKGA